MNKLIVYIILLYIMQAKAQITSEGFDSIRLNENISQYPASVNLLKYADRSLFRAKPENCYYQVPITAVKQDPIKIKYAFVFTDDHHTIKKVSLLIDDSDSTAIVTLEGWLGKEHTTAWTSLDQVEGHISYGWVTPEKTVIIMNKTTNVNRLLGFSVTQIEIYKQEDYGLIEGNFIRAKLFQPTDASL